MLTNSNSSERRIARIAIENELLIAMMTDGFEGKFKTIEGIPPGAVFIEAVNDLRTGQCWFLFSHPSFAIVHIGGEIPFVTWRGTHAY